jgi:valyl-tRNA synthetase
MSGETAKNYDPASIEAEAIRVWIDEKCFAADPSAPGEAYCIVIPPPNVTGALHLGHAINNTLQDVMIRNHRMRGFNALWVPGIDHAGIATQAVVEKQLKEKENKTRHDLGREELVRRIWEWKQEYGDRILEQIKRMGCSCDWDRLRFTLDEQCARAVRETFFKLFRDGLIYRGKRMVNWDIHLQTSISDDEIFHETVKTSMWHIRYPISGTDKAMIVATTRPETMLGDTAVAVHSEDGRWNWAIGKSVDLPLVNKRIPIIADDILVDPKFGSGVVKVTPAHDPNDYAVWQRHLGKSDAIEIVNILNPDGTINENGGKYAGMKREAARKKVVEDLEGLGLMVKEEPYETQVGHSDRSKTPVEPYLSDQWFVTMAPLAEPALQVVREGIVQFFPERHAQQYLSWLGEKRDWPISRQLWWGHRIPVWSKVRPKGDLTEGVRIIGTPEAVLPSSDSASVESFRVRTKKGICEFAVRREIRENDFVEYVSIQPGFGDIEQQIEKDGYSQDSDVLDTWFSSGLWPHSTLGWPEETAELRKWYPTNVLATGRDIITLWVARMVMLGMYNMGGRDSRAVDSGAIEKGGPHPSPLPEYRERGEEGKEIGRKLGIPFHHVYIHPTILDGKGERMSKSKGNGVDPLDIIQTHGADAMRFTLTLMATETQDVRMPVKKDAQGRNTSDKFDIGRFFCNKIWNVANHFVIANLASVKPVVLDESKWSLADRWIVSRFNRTVGEADSALGAYRFDQYAKICYDFFWEDFCSWYVEASKPAMKDSQRAGQTGNVLAAVLDGVLRLMHPMVPFITETIWWKLNEVRGERSLPGWVENEGSKRLVHARWPRRGRADDEAENELFPRIKKVIQEIRRLRTDFEAKDNAIVSAIVASENPKVREEIEGSREMIELLAKCTIRVETRVAVGEGIAHASAGDCMVVVENLVNEDVERERTSKRKEELAKQKQTLGARLANEAYISKAPAKLVQQTKDQLAEVEAELGKLG